MIIKKTCQYVGSAIGAFINPVFGKEVGGIVGRFIGSLLDNGAIEDVFTDPNNWREGMAIKAEYIRELGWDPFDPY